MKKYTRPQEIVFEIMELASFNAFDGENIVRLLKENSNLWEAVFFGRHYMSLIQLRDIPDGHWNADTLWILPEKGKEKELTELASGFLADNVEWLSNEKSSHLLGSGTAPQVLEIWWD